MSKVILIGGSPMVGKSTIAVSLAAKLQCQCISTDDIGEALQTTTDIDPMRGQNYLDYYADNGRTKLIEDIIEYHKKLEPAIYRLIDIHSTWGNPLIMEGWALYPNRLKDVNSNVFSCWLIAGDDLLENRLLMNNDFYINAREPEKVIENYLYRSQWHNKLVLEQCRAENQNHLFVNEKSTTVEIVSSILDMLDRY